MKKLTGISLLAVFALGACTKETVVYEHRYHTAPSRTVYVKERTYTPASSSAGRSMPGQAVRMPEPGAPSSFRAESAN